MIRKLRLLCVLLLICVAGCADIKEMPANARYIVVTRFGDALTLDMIRLVIGLNDYRVFQDDTDIGKLFRDGTVDILNKESSWVYVPTDVQIDAPKFDGDYGDYRSDLISNWHKTAARFQKLKQTAAASHADIAIYIAESITELPTPPIGNPFAREEMIGRGLFKKATIGFPDRNIIFVSYEITVYDTHTWKSRVYASAFTASFPQFDWPKPHIPPLPLPDNIQPNLRDALSKIEPPADLPFALCYLGLTGVSHDPLEHARAYACAQHYGVPNSSLNNVPVYWLDHPIDTNHWNLHQQ